MEKEVFISLYLDTRRAKSNGKYPVKIAVIPNNLGYFLMANH